MLTVILSIVPYLIMNIISLFIETQQLLGDLSRSWLSCLGSLVFLLQETFMKSLKIPKGYLALCVPDEDLFCAYLMKIYFCAYLMKIYLCAYLMKIYLCAYLMKIYFCAYLMKILFFCVPDEDFAFVRT